MKTCRKLLNSIKEFTETPDEEGELLDKTMGSYLQQITLLTDADQGTDENSDVVKLMTIHAAKGLEFRWYLRWDWKKPFSPAGCPSTPVRNWKKKDACSM
jgi:superfamily I DNA/RNA helicase